MWPFDDVVVQIVVSRNDKRETFSTAFAAGAMRNSKSALSLVGDLSHRLQTMILAVMRDDESEPEQPSCPR